MGAVGAAFRVAESDLRGATIFGAAAAAAFVIKRALSASARVQTECDVFRASARALLETDVLAVPANDLHRVVFEGNSAARNVLAGILPALVADAVASVVIAPVLASLLPPRVLILAAVGAACVLVSLVALRRKTLSAQQRALAATDEIVSAMTVAIEGRLELVARGGESSFAKAYDASLAKYMHVATRAAWGTALLGRAPIAFGALAILAIIGVDGASRDALTAALLGQTVLLLAAMPAFFGVVVAMHELVKNAPTVAPLLSLLTAPRRAELARVGADACASLSPVHLDDVTFAYDSAHSPIFRGINASWNADQPLLVLGQNGGGKSTVLRLLLGLRPPTDGTLRIGSKSLAEVDLQSFRQQIAYLPQRPYLGEPHQSIRDAMRLGRPDAPDDIMRENLLRCGLVSLVPGGTETLDTRIGELSAGQKQRVALARILMQNAPIVILDEPDANLDRAGIELVERLVKELVAEGKMVAVAAHAAELTALPAVRITLGEDSKRTATSA